MYFTPDELASQLKAVQGLRFLPAYREEIIPLIDLTRLHKEDTAENMAVFAQGAVTAYGKVAALCVYPRFVKQMASLLKESDVKIATVVNFPSGNESIQQVLQEIQYSIAEGAEEIDVVFPYQTYLKGHEEDAIALIRHCKTVCSTHCLKVILETGALKEPFIIAKATKAVVRAGADFVKTSTGQYPEGASLEAAAVILLTLSKISTHINHPVGLKVSGSIREPLQAWQYVQLAKNILGESWVNPTHFRIGASHLLTRLIEENTPQTKSL